MMIPSYRHRFVALALACLLNGAPVVSAREISSYAFINDDGSLRINGKTIRLRGIYIPDTGRTCQTRRNPPICGSRGVLALNFKIDGFVRCEITNRFEDNSLEGRCRVNANHFDDGEDLSAYLLERGWAVALPDASIEYQTLEKIARSRGVGIWGFSVDQVIPRR